MLEDDILTEIRKYREDWAKRFKYDIHAMAEDARKRQVAGGRKAVSLPAKKPIKRVVASK